MITVAIAGRASGSVMRVKIDTGPAPSTRAASKYSVGIAAMPAMKIKVAMPTNFHTSIHATVSRARCGSVSQPGPWMPKKFIENSVHKPVVRVQECLEREADADGRDQHGEEDHGAEVSATEDRAM